MVFLRKRKLNITSSFIKPKCSSWPRKRASCSSATIYESFVQFKNVNIFEMTFKSRFSKCYYWSTLEDNINFQKHSKANNYFILITFISIIQLFLFKKNTSACKHYVKLEKSALFYYHLKWSARGKTCFCGFQNYACLTPGLSEPGSWWDLDTPNFNRSFNPISPGRGQNMPNTLLLLSHQGFWDIPTALYHMTKVAWFRTLWCTG